MNHSSINIAILKKSVIKGSLAFLILLSVYFSLLTLVSGWNYTLEQFAQFWYYVTSLALGFGVQLSLYSYLKGVAKEQVSKGQLVTTGTTSTTAMISCCAHYLTNILPILGVSGIITFITQYQVQFFWVGLVFNLLGIIYIGSKVVKITGVRISKSVIFYSALLVVILTVFFLNSTSINISSKRTENASKLPQPSQSPSNRLETKESNDGPASVAVTPQSIEGSSSWNFDVTLNTHSKELSEDLVAVSELVDDQGKSYKPISWEGAPPGGHHREGVLKFNPISPKPKSLELKIKNVGGIPERSFKWSL